jgi:branched-chain amino acid transport system ATP-binding protein
LADPVAAILEVRGLEKRFGGYVAVHALDMDVEAGSIHAVIGPNGAGKTTLFNIVTGVLAPSAGTIAFRGADIAGRRPDRITALGIARTFQGVRLWSDMSVLENVMMGRHLRTRGGFLTALGRLPGREPPQEVRTRRRAEEILDLMGLGSRRDVAAGDLSLADQRRLEIARGLATEPRLLLLDEPVAGMNPVEVEEAGRLIQKVRDTGITVLLTEHHMSLVMWVSDTVTVLNHGEKIAEGPPDVVKRHPRVLEAYLGAPGPAPG